MIAAVFVPGSLLITSGAHVPSAARYELGTWVAAGRRGSFLLPCSTPEGTAFVSSRPGINIMVSSGTPLLHCPFATCMRVSAAKGKLNARLHMSEGTFMPRPMRAQVLGFRLPGSIKGRHYQLSPQYAEPPEGDLTWWGADVQPSLSNKNEEDKRSRDKVPLIAVLVLRLVCMVLRVAERVLIRSKRARPARRGLLDGVSQTFKRSP
jgi:hypothetical protein